MITAAAILAAGRSKRFGSTNKLLAMCDGKPLAEYAIQSVKSLNVNLYVAAVSDDHVGDLLPSFELIKVKGTQSDSLKACVTHARAKGADRLLVVLADMPFVETCDLQKLMESDPNRVSALTDGTIISVPACFPSAVFDQLLMLEGEKGARDILRQKETQLIHVQPKTLIDIDTPETHARYFG